MNLFTSLQWAGPVLALTTFVTIGIGHVLVRYLQAHFGTRPAIPFFISGGIVLIVSLFTPNHLISAILGLIGITLVWDGIEIYRQEKRMRREK
jgi:hypothetical protein